MGSATKSGSQKGSRGNAPCRVQGRRPCWGLGQRPNCSSSNQFKRNSPQRCRQRSVPAPNFARPQTRPPSRSTQQLCCVAPNGRDQVAGLATIAALSRTQGFRLCGGESGALRSPPTPLRSALPCYLIFIEAFYDDAAFSQTSEFQPARRFFAHAPACSCASVSITASEAFG